MRFPVFYPFKTDRIKLLMYDKRTFVDEFICNLTENIQYFSHFNLNTLKNNHGTLKYTWVNCYGIPYEERVKDSNYYEGTDYFGRVLVQMNLIQVDRPEKKVIQYAVANEPPTLKYGLKAVVSYFKSSLSFKAERIVFKIKLAGKELTTNTLYRNQKSDMYNFKPKEGDGLERETIEKDLPEDKE
jgi:hypothetical protein